MTDDKCPYCNADVEICHDGGVCMDDGQRYEQQCDWCKKSFIYRPEVVVSHKIWRADCLNGGKHDYKKRSIQFDIYVCEVCGHWTTEPEKLDE